MSDVVERSALESVLNGSAKSPSDGAQSDLLNANKKFRPSESLRQHIIRSGR
jgi:hypothetical protein